MKLINWRLYVITPEIENYKVSTLRLLRQTTEDRQITNYIRIVEEAILGGAEAVQFRSKNLTDREYCRIGRNLRSLTKKYHIPLIVNNRLDLALAISADGVHLGQNDLPISEVRKIVIGYRLTVNRFVVGVSTHSIAQAIKAEKEGADYIGIGPVFATPSKPEYEPIGLGIIGKLKKKIKIPFFAIGGINQNNLKEVISSGVERIAVIRAVFAQKNIGQNTQRLRDLLVTE